MIRYAAPLMPLIFLTDLSYKSLRLVKCSEFRNLLLFLRRDLRDADIPHWSKVRDLVLDSWSTYFDELKLNLEVRPSSTLLWHVNIPCPECRGSDIIHMRHMV
jgi:hypothetical protein